MNTYRILLQSKDGKQKESTVVSSSLHDAERIAEMNNAGFTALLSRKLFAGSPAD